MYGRRSGELMQRKTGQPWRFVQPVAQSDAGDVNGLSLEATMGLDFRKNRGACGERMRGELGACGVPIIQSLYADHRRGDRGNC